MSEIPPGLSIIELARYSHITTQNGRPIAELAASRQTLERARAKGISLRTAPLKIPDSRYGVPGNVAGYGAMMRGRQAILDGLAWINRECFGEDTPTEVTKAEVYGLTRIGRHLPMYLLHRAESQYVAEGSLPNVVGDIFKASAGLRLAFSPRNLTVPETAFVTPRETYELANRLKMLLTNNRGCPATPEVIVETAQALLFRTDANPDASELATLGINMSNLNEFSKAVNGFDQRRLEIEAILKHLMRPQERTVEQAMQFTLKYTAWENQALSSLNAYQTKANEVLHRDTSKTPKVDHKAIVGEFGTTPVEALTQIILSQPPLVDRLIRSSHPDSVGKKGHKSKFKGKK